MSDAEWMTLSDAAAELGLARSSVSRRARAQGWARKKEGRSVLVRREAVEAYRRAHRRGARPGPRPAPDELSVAEFARRAEVSERRVQIWKNDGLISGYTLPDLEKVIGEGEPVDADVDAVEVAEADAVAETDAAGKVETREERLSPTMSLADLRRRKEYWHTRRLKAAARKFEGAVYDARELDARARRVGQLIAARVQEVPQRWAERLAQKPVEEVRAQLSVWAREFLAELGPALESAE